jgi:PAS domain S-box-containing protein
MAESIRVLILEDNPADAELMQFELREAGCTFNSKVVVTEREYVQALHDYHPDLILSDYDLPRYTGTLALSEAIRRCPETPFILVTGALGEDRALEILAQGAKDYVLKTRLQQRLAPAVRRALAEAGERNARKKAEKELRESHRTLEEQVEIRTAALQAEIAARKRMEDALKESESVLRAFFDSPGMFRGIVEVTNGDIRYVSASVTTAAVYGLTPDAVCGRLFSDLGVPPVTIREYIDRCDESHRTGLAVSFEVFRHLADGDGCLLVTVSYLGTEPAGCPRFAFATLDITERKRAEQETAILAEIRRMIGSTLEIDEVYERVATEIRKLIPFDSLVVNLSNAQQQTLDVAYASGLDIPGRRAGESFSPRGTIGEEVIKTRQGMIIQSENQQDLVGRFPSLVVSVRAGMHSVLCVPLIARDEVIGNLFMRSQRPGAYAQQDLLLAERVGAQIAAAIANAELFKDLKQMEKTLRESEKRYRELNDFLPMAIFEVDAAGNLLSFNRTALEVFRYDEEDYNEGMNALQFFAPADWQRVGEDLEKVIRGTAARGQEYAFIRKDGSTFSGLIYAAPVIHQDTAVGVRGTIVDITERKRAEEEKHILEERLHRAEKMEALGQLAGGVAHDLNNVLGVSTVYSELLQEKIPAGTPLRKYVDNILSSTQKGAAIIEDLLTLARRGVAVSDVMNLNGIVSTFLKNPVFEKIQAYHPGVTFKTECQAELLNIKGSPLHLEKTLTNLVSNAAEAIPGKGEVIIRTENRYLDGPVSGYDDVTEGDYAVLIVSDTGTGIPAESIGKIFEPFYTKKTMGRSGTGLGLAIVWGTVKDHKGYIDIQTADGKGTTFTLYFPVTRETVVPQQQKAPIERYMGKGESVLVVDDIAEQRDVASRLLTRLRYEVHAVSNGEEAVAYLKENRADILVLDMIMAPGIDGLETYKRVLEVNPKQKAILVSGFSETDRVKEAQRLGAGAYVKKPYMMEKISAAIRDELQKG